MAAMSGMAMNNTSPVDNHLEPMAPPSGDPRFIEGSTGAFGQSKKIVQADGPAYGGQPVEKNQNANDKKQQNYGVTDANFTHTLGVIADPDTGQPMSYAQTMQAYNAVGAIQSLAPDIYAQLVKNQDAGLGTVQGGALAIMGITQTDGQGGKSLTGIDQAAMAKMASAQLPGLGSVKDMVLSTTDFKGRAWNRAHHSAQLVELDDRPGQQGLELARCSTVYRRLDDQLGRARLGHEQPERRPDRLRGRRACRAQVPDAGRAGNRQAGHPRVSAHVACGNAPA